MHPAIIIAACFGPVQASVARSSAICMLIEPWKLLDSIGGGQVLKRADAPNKTALCLPLSHRVLSAQCSQLPTRCRLHCAFPLISDINSILLSFPPLAITLDRGRVREVKSTICGVPIRCKAANQVQSQGLQQPTFLAARSHSNNANLCIYASCASLCTATSLLLSDASLQQSTQPGCCVPAAASVCVGHTVLLGRSPSLYRRLKTVVNNSLAVIVKRHGSLL